MYLWEPTEVGYYPTSVQPEATTGYFYDVLRVEQSAEGWHAILMELHEVNEDDEWADALDLYDMVDEKVFDSKYGAVAWCEERDTAKAPDPETWGEV